MTLEAVVSAHARFPQTSYTELWSYEFDGLNDTMLQCDSASASGGGGIWDPSTSFMLPNVQTNETATGGMGRRKRRRATRCRNQQVVESRRMNHIAVERHRRKQMNDYLAVIQSLMPPSYIIGNDQASIVGGAINYVKQLEQLLQSLEAQRLKQNPELAGLSFLFPDFLALPRYSSSSCHLNRVVPAEIEVSIVEGHANLKVLSRQRPKQLMKLVEGLQRLRLTTLHLNLITADRIVFYSFSLKVEDDCRCTSVDEITGEVDHILGSIEEQTRVRPNQCSL